ncbi:flagellar basal body P-ring protein FlgI [Cohaesibacter celericrescens]|uniref:Flagellar P-ring protein n=1 Tax=Cohaesibacter celericrescens TaxID=2067669 RepID=A0A2N5XWQ7_9HYPH|nr:flagellar basal body P-ring protein FlgI [Cohaesibacter celericrescens]PLW75490.1 flagellar biosynthesis protein FlgI [Cohaesibacter celericrescens]PLW78897.1 flagellar biosynthesis protein FlgI [Cohaesibacter celericrescens]
MQHLFKWFLAGILCLTLSIPGHAAVRIKDITSLEGVRDNQLVGYGLVIGLLGTGDTLRNAPFTEQSLQSMLDSMGVNVRDARLRTRNVAAVVVTANFPAFVQKGTRIDVTVSSLGDASSLSGGTLIVTPLMGADGQVYAIAQGSLAVSGLSAKGDAQSLQVGTATSGLISNGAIVERALGDSFANLPNYVLQLSNPDFKTAVRVADAINAFSRARYGVKLAKERDFRSVILRKPSNITPTRFIAEIEGLAVQPDTPARVVVDERTGTVVIGSQVQISTVAVTHGNLVVRITEQPVASQPQPFSRGGETVVLPETNIEAAQSGGPLKIIGGTDLQTLVSGLNRIGLRPSGVISILQAIKTAGALQAELVIQ